MRYRIVLVAGLLGFGLCAAQAYAQLVPATPLPTPGYGMAEGGSQPPFADPPAFPGPDVQRPQALPNVGQPGYMATWPPRRHFHRRR